jgi:hypothetical protein
MVESKTGNLLKCTGKAMPKKVFEARRLPEVSSAASRKPRLLLQDGKPVAFYRLNLRISLRRFTFALAAQPWPSLGLALVYKTHARHHHHTPQISILHCPTPRPDRLLDSASLPPRSATFTNRSVIREYGLHPRNAQTSTFCLYICNRSPIVASG